MPEQDPELLQLRRARSTTRQFVQLVLIQCGGVPKRLDEPAVLRKRRLVPKNPPVRNSISQLHRARCPRMLLQILCLARDPAEEVPVTVRGRVLPTFTCPNC